MLPLTPGTLVRALFTKWDGRRHWEFDATVLGIDEYGVWTGLAPCDLLGRPGLAVRLEAHSVTLFPHRAWHVATFNAPRANFRSRIYVDMTTESIWSNGRGNGDAGAAGPSLPTVSAVDMDLDVIRRFEEYGGEIFVDDEDEFLEHQVSMGYPPAVVDATRASADAVLAAITNGAEPFGRVGPAWLQRCLDTL